MKHCVCAAFLFCIVFAQAQLPAAFNDYDRFVTEFSKLPGWKWYIADYDECHRTNAWKKVYPGVDSLSAVVYIHSPNRYINQINSIEIHLSDNVDFSDYPNEKKLQPVLVDVHKVVGDKNFSKLKYFSNYLGENVVTDAVTTLITHYQLSFSRSSAEGMPTTTNYGLSLSFTRPEHYKPIEPPDFSDTAYVYEDTLKPEHYLPAKPVNGPQTNMQAVLTNWNALKAFTENITGNPYVITEEDEGYMVYESSNNPGFSCQYGAEGDYQIKFTVMKGCFTSDSISWMQFSFEQLGRGVTSRYWPVHDSLMKFLGVRPESYFTTYRHYAYQQNGVGIKDDGRLGESFCRYYADCEEQRRITQGATIYFYHISDERYQEMLEW